MNGCADQPFGQGERCFVDKALHIHARLEVLRWRTDVGLKVKWPKRRWFGFARERQLRRNDGEQVRRQWDVGICVT